MTATVAWPAQIPLPSIAGYALKPRSNIDRAEMEVGPARQRRRGTRKATDIAVQLDLTLWQQMLFESWHRWEAEEGGVFFDMPLLFPVGLTTVEARFKGDTTMTPSNGQRWRVTATLEVLERPMLTAAELTALLDDDGVSTAWPAMLPLPSFGGYQLKPKPAIARTESEDGPADQRRRSLMTPTELPVQIELDQDQAKLFDAWYRWRAREGAAWFPATHLGGLGLVTGETRFKDDLTLTPRDRSHWSVAATLELRDRPMLDAADLEIALTLDPAEAFAAVEALHHLVHFEFPAA